MNLLYSRYSAELQAEPPPSSCPSTANLHKAACRIRTPLMSQSTVSNKVSQRARGLIAHGRKTGSFNQAFKVQVSACHFSLLRKLMRQLMICQGSQLGRPVPTASTSHIPVHSLQPFQARPYSDRDYIRCPGDQVGNSLLHRLSASSTVIASPTSGSSASNTSQHVPW